MSEPDDPRRLGPVAVALLALAPVVAAAVIGNLATIPNLAPWYAGLVKPSFNPPNGVFCPVWTLLYLMMVAAFWRVLRLDRATPGRRAAIGWFLTQMVLNASWSVAFFGLRSPLAGVVVIGWLLVAIGATIRAFAPLDRLAAGLLVPYLAWVSFAAVLNTAVWALNR